MCKHTERQGFFNCTHISKDHCFPKQKISDSDTLHTTTSSPASTASSISSLGSGSTAPQGNLNALATAVNKLQLPPIKEQPPMDPDPDGLEFVCAFVVDLVDDNTAWVATAPDPEDISLSVGVTLTSTNDEV